MKSPKLKHAFSAAVIALGLGAALPAHANTFFEFSFAFGEGGADGVLSGTTAPGANQLGTYSWGELDTLNFNGSTVYLYDDEVSAGGFGTAPARSSLAQFTISGTLDAPQVSFTDGWVFAVGRPWQPGDTHYHFRSEEAVQEPDGGRLSSAVVPEQTEHLASRHTQR